MHHEKLKPRWPISLISGSRASVLTMVEVVWMGYWEINALWIHIRESRYDALGPNIFG